MTTRAATFFTGISLALLAIGAAFSGALRRRPW